MPRKLEAQLAGRYLMSSVLMTSTMKSEPATPPIAVESSCGVPVSAAMVCAFGGSADAAVRSGAGGAGCVCDDDSTAVAVAATAVPVKNLRRLSFGPNFCPPSSVSLTYGRCS